MKKVQLLTLGLVNYSVVTLSVVRLVYIRELQYNDDITWIEARVCIWALVKPFLFPPLLLFYLKPGWIWSHREGILVQQESTSHSCAIACSPSTSHSSYKTNRRDRFIPRSSIKPEARHEEVIERKNLTATTENWKISPPKMLHSGLVQALYIPMRRSKPGTKYPTKQTDSPPS